MRAGLGVGLMANAGQDPDGLVKRSDLPVPARIPLSVWARRGLSMSVINSATQSIREMLTAALQVSTGTHPDAGAVTWLSGTGSGGAPVLVEALLDRRSG